MSANPCELATVRQLHSEIIVRFVSTTPLIGQGLTMEALFLRLSALGEGTEDTKRRVDMDEGGVTYFGAIDDDTGPDKPGKTNYAAKAIDELAAGKAVTTTETKPYGCSVKYGSIASSTRGSTGVVAW